MYDIVQIKVYSEVGGIPQAWNQHQKGTVFRIPYLDKENIKFMQWPIDTNTFVKLCLIEYVFVSLSLALVITKFFPAIHSEIVSRATSLEYQSLYWGAAVVSNVFVYGLLLTAARGFNLVMFNTSQIDLFHFDVNHTAASSTFMIIIPIMQEVISVVILFFVALVTSVRTRSRSVPRLPKGMAKFIVNISFCFTCFCCCVCCSQHCRAKSLGVLVLFSFMTITYHGIMTVISAGFMLFIDALRTNAITITALFISLVIFMVVLVSLSIFLLSRGRNVAMYQQVLNCCGSIILIITVFIAVMLLIVLYMIIFFSLNLTGFKGIVTGLTPSIALSAATWYIKKRLKTQTAISTEHGIRTTCGSVNNEEMTWETDPERQCVPR